LLDKGTAKAILYIELAKPPSVLELIKMVAEKESKFPLEDYKNLQTKLIAVKTLEDLDKALLELSLLDFNMMSQYLSKEFLELLRVIMETSELELVYSKLGVKVLNGKPLQYVKLVDYSKCSGIMQFSCIISTHLLRLKNVCEKTGEDCERALAILALLDAFFYNRYLNNLKTLKLGEELSLQQLIGSSLGFLKGSGVVYFESGLAKLLEAIKHREDLVEMWCCGVMTLYDIAKNALYYTNKLIDLVTLFGIDRLFRYSLLRILFSRWLRPW
jgi:hypothetical protein